MHPSEDSDSGLSRRALLRGLACLPLAACAAGLSDSDPDSAGQETAEELPLPEQVLERMTPDATHLDSLGIAWAYSGSDFAENKAFAEKLRHSFEGAGLLLETRGNQTLVSGPQEDIRILVQSVLDGLNKSRELPDGKWSCSISEQSTCTAVYFKVEA